MTKSTWEEDLVIEQEISKFLDKYFYAKLNELNSNWEFKKFNRIENLDKQNNGVNVEVQFLNNQIKNIDEKAAAKYFNFPLKTFALELIYEKNGNIKEGWLFGEKYSQTDTYLFIWGKNLKDKKIRADNITELEIYSIDKKQLLEDVNNRYGINKHNYKEFSNEIIENSEVLSYPKAKNIEWRYSKKMHEKPLLILYSKEILWELSKSCFKVNKNGVELLKC